MGARTGFRLLRRQRRRTRQKMIKAMTAPPIPPARGMTIDMLATSSRVWPAAVVATKVGTVTVDTE